MSHTPPVDSKGAAIRAEILEIAIRWRQAVEKLEKIEGKLPSKYLEDAILALLAQEVEQAQTNAVAWAVGVIDEMHIKNVDILDHTYKGIKNTLRDRYKAETGVDPAPNYPIKAGLV